MASHLLQSGKKDSSVIKSYLFAYNSFETVGWIIVLLQLVNYYLSSESATTPLYQYLKWPLIIFQNAAILEILHAATRIVASNPIVTVQQVFSRVIVVCGVIIPTMAGKTSIGLSLAVLAWSITEIIRYAYYALNLANSVPQILLWLRYTTFILLYPIGVTGELLCLYAAQEEVRQTELWTIHLPNSLNFSFYYRFFLLGLMALYIPLFPQLYMHMFTLRKKVLGTSEIRNKEE